MSKNKLRKDVWNEYAVRGFTCGFGGDPRAHGNICSYQIRRKNGQWEKRLVNVNMNWTDPDIAKPLSDEEGERIWELLVEREGGA